MRKKSFFIVTFLVVIVLISSSCTNKVTSSNGNLNINYIPLDITYTQNRGTIEISEYKVKNIGTDNDTTSTVEIGFFMSSDEMIEITDLILGSDLISGLDAGEEYTGSLNLTIPQDTGSGLFYLGMYIDVNDNVNETDETDNDFTGGEIEMVFNPTIHDFGFIVQAPFFRDTYSINVYNYSQTTPIDDVQLLIDGNPVAMSGQDYIWFGEYDLTPGTTYNFDLTINSTLYNFDLQTCSSLDVDWPDIFYPTLDTPINWTQTNDPDYQDFYLEGEDLNEDWQYIYTILNPSVRLFTIPANWIGVELIEYYLSIWTVKYIETGDLIALSDEWDGMGYARGKSGVKTEFDRVNRIRTFIENIK